MGPASLPPSFRRNCRAPGRNDRRRRRTEDDEKTVISFARSKKEKKFYLTGEEIENGQRNKRHWPATKKHQKKVKQCECRRLILHGLHNKIDRGDYFSLFVFFEEKLISIFHRETTHKTPPGFKRKKKEKTDLKEDFGLPPKEIKMTKVYWVISIFVQSITLPCLMKKRCEDGACLFKKTKTPFFVSYIYSSSSKSEEASHSWRLLDQ